MKTNSRKKHPILDFWRNLPLVGTPSCEHQGIELGKWHKARFDLIDGFNQFGNSSRTLAVRGGILGRHEFSLKETPKNREIERRVQDYLKNQDLGDLYPIVGFVRSGAYSLPLLNYLALHSKKSQTPSLEVHFFSEYSPSIIP
jgi:hypothetical protein